MSDRVLCPQCGASILRSTAEKNAGLCMPCKGGYRKNIEASKARSEEEKKYRETPEHKLWNWLVDQAYKSDDGLSKLSHENQIFFATNLLVGDVYNGGFDQYFHNSSADYFNFAIEGLTIMGATKSIALLISAKELIFGNSDVPSSTSERRTTLSTQWESCRTALENGLEKLDKEFWSDPDQLSERMIQFAKKHDLYGKF